MGYGNRLKSLVLAAKYPFGVSLRKNGSLGELRHQGFIAFLVVVWIHYGFMTVAHGKDYDDDDDDDEVFLWYG